MPEQSNSRRFALAAAGIVALVFCAYSASAGNGFVWDDHAYVEFNPALTSFSELRHAFGSDANQGPNPQMPLSYNYRPLTFASLYVNAKLLGPTARSFHLGNIALHAALALLLLVILRRRVGGPWALGASLVATAWWALHPEHAETVAWASGRYDLLGALFCAIALFLQSRRGPVPTVMQGLAILLAVMAKESFITMFAVLAVDDWAQGRIGKHSLARYGFFAVIFCGWQWMRLQAGTGTLVGRLFTRPLTSLTDFAAAVSIYSWRAVAPLPLSVSHTYRPIEAAAAAAVIVALVALLALIAVCRREWLTPIATFAILLVPVGLALRAAGSSAERYFYGPSIGLAWLLAAALAEAHRLRAPLLRRAVVGLALVVVAFDFTAVARRTLEWRSDKELFSAELDQGVDDWLGQEHMAVIELGLDDLGPALEHAQTARRHALAAGATPASVAQILSTEAMVYLRLGDGRAALERTLAAMQVLPTFPYLHLEAAMAFNRLGDERSEMRELQEALRLSPGFAEARIALCRLKHSHRDFEGARQELARVPATAAKLPGVDRALRDARDEIAREGD